MATQDSRYAVGRSRLAIGSTLVALSLLLGGCKPAEQQAQSAPPPPEIRFVEVKLQAIELKDQMPGRTVASFIAEVRPQVGGIILKQLFTEGALIEKGQPLYQIDPEPFEVAFRSAKSDLQKANANLATAQNRAARYERLVKQNAVSRQDFDDALANFQQAESDVAIAKAAIETARINLDYTKVTSPISGRIGRSTVTEGALVTANQASALVTVQTYDPMYVDITASSNELLAFNRGLQSGAFSREEGELSDIQLTLEDDSVYPFGGKFLFSDVNIDQTTGSFVLRLSFENPNNTLLPGMFVRATLPRGIDHKAILIPAKALSRTPRGQAQVSVINADNVVEVRPVETEEMINNQWLVTKGLNAGDRVIAEGLQFVRPGAPVANPVPYVAKAAKEQ
ncbi:efflux RND transporter periplasmic adaptor subunit [Ferrimonas aestuarii]|uniref:Efflux RND transporter periplasmic adaptor subunit n=1 Tax=Ferrimonas aestuarii TaxID=2569539 RepID=A0A4U1BES3_9GAMM|nr:efflux RND transporter periplasmic adaptor subunit [Ferrimonas aestuarii]TKB49165.1 efflux RND transporter periplasmic adaptor subunit [Ferrimonas aestuarii]